MCCLASPQMIDLSEILTVAWSRLKLNTYLYILIVSALLLLRCAVVSQESQRTQSLQAKSLLLFKKLLFSCRTVFYKTLVCCF